MYLLGELDRCVIVTELSTTLGGCSESDTVVYVEDTIGSAWRPDGDGRVNLVFFGIDISFKPRGTRNAGACCGLMQVSSISTTENH